MRTLPVISLLAWIGCRPAPDVEMRSAHDTTGARIAVNSSQLWRSDEEWRIDPNPMLELGGGLGDSVNDLFAIKSIDRLANGNIVLAHAGNYQLKIYDPNGKHVRDVGRKGGGPGDFLFIDHMVVLPGDTIAVMDSPPQRGRGSAPPKLLYFDSAGRFVRSTLVKADRAVGGGNTNPVFSNGFRVLKNGAVMMDLLTVASPSTKEYRPPTGFSILRMSDGVVDTIGWFPGVIHVRRSPTENDVRWFSPQTHIAVGPAAIFIGDSKSYEIGRYDLNGTLQLIIRRTIKPSRVRKVDIDRARADWIKVIQSNPGNSARHAEQEKEVMRQPVTRWKPSFRRLVGDTEGNLWVAPYEGERGRNDWSVFDIKGRWLGDVDLPIDELPIRIERNAIFTRLEDGGGYGIQRFRLYRLHKATGN
jgi:hypothetical protein